MKILIIGLGSIALKHIDAIKEVNPNSIIYALRRKGQPPKDVEGVSEIFDIADIDISEITFILICNPTSEHYITIKELFQHRKPLFIEKPLFSEISSETQLLVKEVEKKNIQTYIACNLRFLDSIVKAKELIKGSRINEVNVYCGSYLPNWRPNVDFRTVYSANKEMGGGVHIDLIHELDYVYWLFGIPSRVNSFFANKSSLCISAYDYANYLWEYEGFSASIILNYYRKDSKRTLEIITDKGTFLVDLLKNNISFEGKIIYNSSQKVQETYFSQMNFFINTILKNDKRFNTITEANKVLELCLQ